jgi:hypothetical protein
MAREICHETSQTDQSQTDSSRRQDQAQAKQHLVNPVHDNSCPCRLELRKVPMQQVGDRPYQSYSASSNRFCRVETLLYQYARRGRQIELVPFKNNARKWINTQSKNPTLKKSRATDLLQILGDEEAEMTPSIAMVLSALNAPRTILYAQDQETLWKIRSVIREKWVEDRNEVALPHNSRERIDYELLNGTKSNTGTMPRWTPRSPQRCIRSISILHAHHQRNVTATQTPRSLNRCQRIPCPRGHHQRGVNTKR